MNTIKKIGIVAFNIFTLGIPCAIYHLVNFCIKPETEQKIVKQAIFSVENEISKKDPEEIKENPTISRCLELYEDDFDGWVVVPNQKELQEGKKPSRGAGGIEGGEFKIHISIDPVQMKQAIPIILDRLHQENTPSVRLKFQTKKCLYDEKEGHQVGKEFALLFSSEAESQEEQTHAIEKVLTDIHYSLKKQGITPEKRLVLTVDTNERIKKSPDGEQRWEKTNIKQRKYDRKMPGSEYFHYRYENYTSISDNEQEDGLVQELRTAGKEERKANRIFFYSDLDDIIENDPEKAHNPLGVKDIFRNLTIR